MKGRRRPEQMKMILGNSLFHNSVQLRIVMAYGEIPPEILMPLPITPAPYRQISAHQQILLHILAYLSKPEQFAVSAQHFTVLPCQQLFGQLFQCCENIQSSPVFHSGIRMPLLPDVSFCFSFS